MYTRLKNRSKRQATHLGNKMLVVSDAIVCALSVMSCRSERPIAVNASNRLEGVVFMHCDFDRTYLIAHMYTTTWIAQKKKEKIEKGR